MPLQSNPLAILRKVHPRIIMIFIMMVSVLSLFVLNFFNHSEQSYLNTNQHYSHVQKLHATVLRIDEVLTMSCWVASTTGDQYWADRYQHNLAKLKKILNELSVVSPKETRRYVEATNDANQILVKYEQKALKAVKGGDTASALTALTHPEYADQKSRYSEAMRHLQDAVDTHFKQKIIKEVDAISNKDTLVFLVSIFLALFWFLACKITCTWHSSFERYQEVSHLMESSLRDRIDENLELAHKRGVQVENLRQALLQSERQERKRLARLVHDDLQQVLVALRLKSAIYRDQVLDHKQSFNELVFLADEAIQSAQEITFRLTLPEDKESTFLQMIKELALQFHRRYGLRVNINSVDFVETKRSEVKVLVYQAIRELLFNVVKHAQVSVVSLVMKREGEFELYGVIDDGVGFEPEEVNVNKDYLSSGLGLMGMRNHLSLIGGEINISSAMRGGSSIWVKIPIASNTILGVRKDSSDQEPSLNDRAFALDEQLKVLVVDDNEPLRSIIVQLINADKSMRVVGEASSGPEAFEVAKVLDFDLLLIDFSLPGYNGAKALENIREIRSDFEAIGFTSFDQPKTILRFEEAGAVEVIIKGGESDQLLQVCRSYLKNLQHQLQN